MGSEPLHNTSDAVTALLPGLKRLAMRALGDQHMAQEIAQETVTRVLVALENGQLRDHSKLASYAAAIARNLIVDVVRAGRKVDSLAGVEALMPCADPDALAELIGNENRQRMRAALLRLPAGDREILHLTYFEGLSSLEVADRLGKTAAVIRKRKERAVARLREVFIRGVNEGTGVERTLR